MTDMLVPAAQYLRMSTDRQEYSIDNQTDAIQQYASIHGFHVIRTYSDAGRSGVSLRRRNGLKQLLADVVGGQVPFRVILVYDVSRWGRFQDLDEAAHYEYLCKSAGVPVHYCGESFKNDQSLSDLIMKALKRTMACEYSRELGNKVQAGLRRIASLGYKAGGSALYGLRRQLLNSDGSPKQILKLGERKSLLTERVVYVSGPEDECNVVRRIFREFAIEGRTMAEIANRLNQESIPYIDGTVWYTSTVSRTLQYLPYMGIQVWGRGTERLHTKRLPVPRERWVFAKLPGEPIVSEDLFGKAQARLANFTSRLSDEQMLEKLMSLYHEHGRLSADIIDKSRLCPSFTTYTKRFGTIRNAYVRIGLNTPEQAAHSLSVRQRCDLEREAIIKIVLETFPDQIVSVRRNRRFRVNFRIRRTGQLISLATALWTQRNCIPGSWNVRIPRPERRHLILLALLDTNRKVQEYWLLPDGKYKPKLSLNFPPASEWLLRGERLRDLSQFLNAVEKMRRK